MAAILISVKFSSKFIFSFQQNTNENDICKMAVALLQYERYSFTYIRYISMAAVAAALIWG